MKHSMLSVAPMCLILASTSGGLCQQHKPQPDRPYLAHVESPRLYFSIPSSEGTGRVELAATNAQLTLSPQANLTSADIEAVLQLRGDVEVKMCAPLKLGCEKWSLLLQADAVDYNEKTRQLDAHGDVHIDPYVVPASH